MSMDNLVAFVELLGAETSIDPEGNSFVYYLLSTIRGGKNEVIARRYRQFRDLHANIRKIPQSQRPQRKDLPKLTGKKWGISSRREDVVEKRKRKLGVYLHELSALSSAYPAIGTLLQAFFSHEQRSPRPSGAHSDSVETGDEEKSTPGKASSRRVLAAFPDNAKVPPPPPRRPVSSSFDSPVLRPVSTPLEPIPSKCRTCERPLPAESTTTPDWDNSQFCSPQCEKFWSATAEKGFAIVHGGAGLHPVAGDGVERSSPAPPTGDKPGWWASKGRGSGTHMFSSALNLFASGRELGQGRKPSFLSPEPGAQVADEVDEEGEGEGDRLGEMCRRRASTPDKIAAEDFMRRARKSEKTGILSKFRNSMQIRSGAGEGSLPLPLSEVEGPTPSSASYEHLLQSVVGRGKKGAPTESGGAEIVHFKGLMFKRGGFHGGMVKSWKKRYFELRDRSLHYFRTSSPTLLGALELMRSPTHMDLSAIVKAASSAGVDARSPDFLEAVLSTSGFFYARVTELSPIAADQLGLPKELLKKDKAPGQAAVNAGITHFGPYVFMVATPERNLFLACETADSYLAWMGTINNIISNERQRIAAILSSLAPARVPAALDGDKSLIPTTAPIALPERATQIDTVEQRRKTGPPILAVPIEDSIDKVGESAVGKLDTTQGDAVTKPDAADAWQISASDLEVVESIGMGAFGEVYRGRLWGTEVAVKLLPPASVTDEILNSLQAEITILSQLRHPNVVLYLGACTTLPDIFVVTEWCERGSLQGLLYDLTVPMSVSNRLGLALQTAQGMSYLHSPRRKVIHRDLKSHNLLVSRDFTVKVADFGLTIVRTGKGASTTKPAGEPAAPETPKSVDQGEKFDKRVVDSIAKVAKPTLADSVFSQKLKLEGQAEEEGHFYGVHGTPQWMAPEVLEGQKYNGSVDVYSFGVVLCELSSRLLPFSDRYKRFDFIDAVLEEGAMPTIPRWCDTLPDAPALWVREHDDTSILNADGTPWGWAEDFQTVEYAKALQTLRAATWPPLVGGCSSSARCSGVSGSQLETSTLVLGGLEEWSITAGDCSGVLRLMIESCLNRDPLARPSFEELVDLLRAVADRPPYEIFLQLEVPRLRDALAYGNDTMAAVAANEILHLSSYALFCNLASLPGAGLRRLRGFQPQTQAGHLHGSGDESMEATTATSRGLVVKFQPESTVYSALLPFSAAPCMNMGHMFGVPYVDLQTVVDAAPQLIAGLCARLRATDLALRAKLGLPLFCEDLAAAVSVGPTANLILLRSSEFGSRGQLGVALSTYDWTMVAADVIQPQSVPVLTESTANSSKKLTAAARAAARAAAAKEAEESRLFKERVSAASHVLHAIEAVLQMMELVSPTLTTVNDDDGEELHLFHTGSIPLPPIGSIDRLLLAEASRLVNSLALVIAATAFSPAEESFLSRPPPGSTVDWKAKIHATNDFPALPSFGGDALCSAASLMRTMWIRLPLLRSAIAHVMATLALHVSSMLGTVTLNIRTPGAASETCLVVPEDILMSRYLGIVIARMGWDGRTDVRHSDMSFSKHALCRAVSLRLKNSVVKRMDGVVLGAVELEEFDPTLC